MTNTRLTLLYLLLLYVIACQPTNPYGDMDAFFGQQRFGGNYFRTFNLLEADTIVQHIQSEVPPQWQGFACQAAYYTMMGEKGVTDSIIFRYLDVIEKAFPADSIVAFTEFVRGDRFVELVRYDTAAACFKKSYDLSNSPLQAASAVNGFAQLALRQNDYPEAIKLYLRNYDYFSSLDTSIEKGRVFNVIKKLANAYTKSQNPQEAHKWYLKAWAFAMTGPPLRRKIYTVESATLLAQSYLSLNQLDSTQIMLDTVVYFQKSNGNYYEEEVRQILRGKIKRAKGDCKAALPYCWSAKHQYKTNRDLAKNYVIDKELADTYACLGRLDSAIYFYQTALATPDSVQRVTIFDSLSKVYILRGDYPKALGYEQKRKELEKRIFTKDKEQTIGRLQAKAEVEKRERALEAEKSQHRLNQVLMISALVVLTFGLILMLSRNRRKQQELQLAAQEKLLLQQQKQLAEADALLKGQVLKKAEAELTVKTTQLEETMQLLDFKNSLIEELQLKNAQNTEGGQALATTKLKNLKILNAEDWRAFRTLFEERFPNFFTKLNQQYPKLSVAETRLFLLIKLGFDSTEIADVLGISNASVYVSRSRLRHRLALDKEDDLERFIQGL